MAIDRTKLPEAHTTEFYCMDALRYSKGHRVEHISGVSGTVKAFKDGNTLVVEWDDWDRTPKKPETAPAAEQQTMFD